MPKTGSRFLIAAAFGLLLGGAGCEDDTEQLAHFCQELDRIANASHNDCAAMGEELQELTHHNEKLVKTWEGLDEMPEAERARWERAQAPCINGLVAVNAACPDHPKVKEAFRNLQ